MHLILHTFRKDIRHLWPAVAVTCLMLGELARQDRWRADSLASPLEGWLNLLLTMAWAMLAALAVLEEPLVGERNFWTTRPHRWPALLASKLVFVLVAIHLPLLLADLYVLAARGFSPADALGPILWKQLLFFGAVTLPSIALASLVRNFTHFVIAVFAIAAGIAILNGGFQRFPDFPRLEIDLTSRGDPDSAGRCRPRRDLDAVRATPRDSRTGYGDRCHARRRHPSPPGCPRAPRMP